MRRSCLARTRCGKRPASFLRSISLSGCCFFFQAEDGIRDLTVTGVQTCALPIYLVVHADQERAGELGVGPEQDRGVGLEVVRLREQPAAGELVEVAVRSLREDREGLDSLIWVERRRALATDHRVDPAAHGRLRAKP